MKRRKETSLRDWMDRKIRHNEIPSWVRGCLDGPLPLEIPAPTYFFVGVTYVMLRWGGKDSGVNKMIFWQESTKNGEVRMPCAGIASGTHHSHAVRTCDPPWSGGELYSTEALEVMFHLGDGVVGAPAAARLSNDKARISAARIMLERIEDIENYALSHGPDWVRLKCATQGIPTPRCRVISDALHFLEVVTGSVAAIRESVYQGTTADGDPMSFGLVRDFHQCIMRHDPSSDGSLSLGGILSADGAQVNLVGSGLIEVVGEHPGGNPFRSRRPMRTPERKLRRSVWCDAALECADKIAAHAKAKQMADRGLEPSFGISSGVISAADMQGGE